MFGRLTGCSWEWRRRGRGTGGRCSGPNPACVDRSRLCATAAARVTLAAAWPGANDWSTFSCLKLKRKRKTMVWQHYYIILFKAAS